MTVLQKIAFQAYSILNTSVVKMSRSVHSNRLLTRWIENVQKYKNQNKKLSQGRYLLLYADCHQFHWKCCSTALKNLYTTV